MWWQRARLYPSVPGSVYFISVDHPIVLNQRGVMLRRIAFYMVVAVPLLTTASARLEAQSRAAAPRVTIQGGTLEGSVDSVTKMLVFRGIPYAAPPVDDLRWRAPRPAARWQGVRDAGRLGHNCMQTQVYGDIDPFAAGVSEDCLNLNVWTAGTRGATRPVLVWIHGGGFRAGFGGEARHDGAHLAQKGAVVVTINYRLGALGFLAHPALAAESRRNASGNYGLLDQIEALRWVRRNIAQFGGDPSRVTIFGESAGGMSVGALIVSPLARGLFHGAILQSGTGIGLGVERRDSAEAHGLKLAASLGVTGSGREAAAALRALKADTLAGAVGSSSGLPIQPVLDGWVVPRPVDSALARGAVNLVPVIVGSNADESDEIFSAPARAFARLVTGRGARAYLYQFTRAGEDSASRRRGAYHSAEITFAFGIPRPIQASAGRASYDATLANAMSDYWVAFAISGDPNGSSRAQRLPRWPAYDAATAAYLELGSTIVARRELRKARSDSLDAVARGRGGVRP